MRNNINTTRIVAIATASTILAACASKPTELETTYVSPLKYQSYSCDQIVMEMDHVSHRTVALYNSLDKKATNDAVQMGVGLLLFWPTLFLLEGGDGAEAAEYSNLKGEFEALRTASVQKECAVAGIKSPEEAIKEQEEKKKVEQQAQNTFN